MSLPAHLEQIRQKIEGHARAFGLDFFEMVFECVDAETLNMIAAYGGFPTRYPHWQFGMQYEQLSKGYTYGLSKIYELVINNDPCYAYLMTSNTDVDQKLVMAHVYGHCDFFKNNYCFAPTHRKMMDVMANHATKVRRIVDRQGAEVVESFLDRCLVLENLIDRQSLYFKRHGQVVEKDTSTQVPMEQVPKLRADREYMQDYINPESFLIAQRQKMQAERDKEKQFPEEPERDVLAFLLAHAPLEGWQQDLLAIVREEAYYFAPQGMTKIMNEGWASYWHTTIMTQKALQDDELIDYADRHAGTMAIQPGVLNPYKLGLELFRDIEERWNMGRFGPEWDACDDLAARQSWNTHAGLGRQKIFEIRRHYNDVTFLDAFLTPEFAKQHQLFLYGYNKKAGRREITSRDFTQMKAALLQQLTNFGDPIIRIINGNHDNRGELFLLHTYEGINLRQDYVHDTLMHLAAIWHRPVLLQSQVDQQPILWRCDGQQVDRKVITSRS